MKTHINESSKLMEPIINELHLLRDKINKILNMLGDDEMNNVEQTEICISHLEKMPCSHSVQQTLRPKAS